MHACQHASMQAARPPARPPCQCRAARRTSCWKQPCQRAAYCCLLLPVTACYCLLLPLAAVDERRRAGPAVRGPCGSGAAGVAACPGVLLHALASLKTTRH